MLFYHASPFNKHDYFDNDTEVWATYYSTAWGFLQLGPVVQSMDSLTTSLRDQFVKYMPTTYANTIIFCWKNVRIFSFAMQKDSHIFPTKSNSAFVIFVFEILTKR